MEHSLTIQQQAREITWPELITLARANLDLAPIHIAVIRDEAKRLSKRPLDDNAGIAITAQCLLTALEDCGRGEFEADDLHSFFDDLDELVCIDDDAREPEYCTRTAGDWIAMGFIGGRS